MDKNLKYLKYLIPTNEWVDLRVLIQMDVVSAINVKFLSFQPFVVLICWPTLLETPEPW